MPREKKNVIIFHVDQQRADSLGCMGNRFARTPVLDRLANEGTLLTRHIASNTICMPSRASLLTGLYPPGHNVWCNGVPLNRNDYIQVNAANYAPVQGKFSPEPVTMADMFACAGYDTSSFGKLHLTPYLGPTFYKHPENLELWASGAFNDWHGPYYGFQHVEMVLGHGEQPCAKGHYSLWLKENHPDTFERVVKQAPEKQLASLGDLFPARTPFELHNSAWLSNRLCDYIRDHKSSDKPFFAFVGFPDPHHPFTPCYDVVREFEDVDTQEPSDPEGAGVSEMLSELSQETTSRLTADDLRKVIRYTYAMVYQIDMAIGRALDVLDAEGLRDDTIVVFTGDHGDFLGDHGLLRKGFAASNSLLHVPFMIRAPGSGLPPRIEDPVSNCDVMPTIAALCGITPPPNLQGRDFAKPDEDRHAFAFNSNGSPESVNYTIYDKKRRMTWYPARDYTEMFDHETDPGESVNIAQNTENKALIEELKNCISRKTAESFNPILGRLCAW